MSNSHPSITLHSDTMPTDAQQQPTTIGIIAGWGDYPLSVAQALRDAGHRVVAVGVRDHCDPQLADMCDHFKWVGLAKLGAAARFFNKHKAHRATMAGKIHKVHLYRPWLWARYLPDWLSIKTFYPHFVTGRTDRKDDTLLLGVVSAFASRGIELVPATDFAPRLLAQEGLIAGEPLSVAQQRDAKFGWEIAKQLGAVDVGQSVCVKGQAVLAIEAIEGTDAAIERAGTLCRSGGFTVVKVAKPQQDMRFDVPTVGTRTLRTMAASGARLLVIEAGKTIILESEQFREMAIRLRVAVWASTAGEGDQILRSAA